MKKRNLMTMLCFFLSVCCLVTVIIISLGHIKEAETTRISLTIENFQISESKSKPSVLLYAKEYPCSFIINSSVISNLNMNYTDLFINADKLIITIQNKDAERIEQKGIVSSVALEVDNKTIYTIDEHNHFWMQSAKPVLYVEFALILFFAVCMITIKKGDRQKRLRDGAPS